MKPRVVACQVPRVLPAAMQGTVTVFECAGNLTSIRGFVSARRHVEL